MAGVPTLFDSLGATPPFKSDLSSLRAAFSGADTLPRAGERPLRELVAERGGHVRLLEGYGLTEAVTAIMATPLHEHREGSVGIPFPDMLAKICELGTTDELPLGEEGEICICGPAVMLGYLDDPGRRPQALRTHADGRTWLHTGDIGSMDRTASSLQLRLEADDQVVGLQRVPGPGRGRPLRAPRGRAVLRRRRARTRRRASGSRRSSSRVIRAAAGDALAAELIEHCKARLIKWSCPRDVEFRAELPLTQIGKIDYRVLEAEAVSAAKARAVPG